jgi:hypothetical protein
MQLRFLFLCNVSMEYMLECYFLQVGNKNRKNKGSVLRRLSKPLLKRTNHPDGANIPGRSRLSRGEECPQLALRLQERELSILCRRRKWKNTIRCLKKLPSGADTLLKHGMVDTVLRNISTFGFVDLNNSSRTEQNIPKLRMRRQVNYRILISMPSIFFSCNFF